MFQIRLLHRLGDDESGVSFEIRGQLGVVPVGEQDEYADARLQLLGKLHPI